MMEYWNDGIKGIWKNWNGFIPFLFPMFHRSSIPLFHGRLGIGCHESVYNINNF